MDMDTSESNDNTALFISKSSGNKKKGKKPSGKGTSDSSSPKSKTCTWGKKTSSGEIRRTYLEWMFSPTEAEQGEEGKGKRER